MQEYLESLVTLKAAIEARNARMALVWIPPKSACMFLCFSADHQAAFVTNRTHDIGGIERVLMQFAKLEGLSFLDMTGRSSVARGWRKAVLHFDGHWNSHGIGAAGRHRADFIKSSRRSAGPRARSIRLLYVRRPVAIEVALDPSAMTARARRAPESNGLGGSGPRQNRSSVISRSGPRPLHGPQWLIATGVVSAAASRWIAEAGKWAMTRNITPWPLDVAIPVSCLPLHVDRRERIARRLP